MSRRIATASVFLLPVLVGAAGAAAWYRCGEWLKKQRSIALILAVCVLASTNVAMSQEEPFTAEEQALVDDLIDKFDGQCKKTAADTRRLTPRGTSGVVMQKLITQPFCSCMVSKMRQALTPDNYRKRNMPGEGNLGAKATANCMQMRLEEEWTEVCPLLVHELLLLRQAADMASNELDNACNCGRKAIAFYDGEASSWPQMLASSAAKLDSCIDGGR